MSELLGIDLRARVAVTPRLLVGTAPRAHVTLSGVRVGQLRIANVDLRAANVRLVPGLPPRLVAHRVEGRVSIEQADLDEWSRRAGLPLRLRLRPGGITTTAGIGGWRVSRTEVDVRVVGGRLDLAPAHVSVLGLGLATPVPPFALPLPRLPRGAELVALDPAERRLDLMFRLRHLDQPLHREYLRLPLGLTNSASCRIPRGRAAVRSLPWPSSDGVPTHRTIHSPPGSG